MCLTPLKKSVLCGIVSAVVSEFVSATDDTKLIGTDMQKMIPLNRILANPYRNPKKYPVDAAKVTTLRESYKQTGVWATLVGRESQKKPGYIEIAFGYHRLAAMWEEFGKKSTKKFPIDVKKLSHAFMLKMMANENMAQHSRPEEVESETVSAVILAYAVGDIAEEMKSLLPKSIQGTMLYAPHFAQLPKSGLIPTSTNGGFPYTQNTLAEFLGWRLDRVKSTLARLAMHEQAPATEAITRGMQPTAATELVRATKRLVAKDAKPAKIAQKMQEIKEEAIEETGEAAGTVRGVVKAAEKVLAKDRKKAKAPLPVNDFVYKKIIPYLEKCLEKSGDMREMLDTVVKHKDELCKRRREQLVIALQGTADRCRIFIEKLETK